MKKYLKSRRRYKKTFWIRFLNHTHKKGGYFDIKKRMVHIHPGEYREGIYLKPGINFMAKHCL